MKIDDVSEEVVDEVKASKELCKSSIPNSKLGASQLSSCKSQGLRAREGKKKYRLPGQKKKGPVKIAGKKIKGKTYDGPIPSYY